MNFAIIWERIENGEWRKEKSGERREKREERKMKGEEFIWRIQGYDSLY